MNDVDDLEAVHFRKVVATFKHYKSNALQRIKKSESIISKLPESHQRRLTKYTTYLGKFKKCVEINNDIVSLMVKDVETMFVNVVHNVTDGPVNVDCDYTNGDVSDHNDIEKVKSVLKTLVRDWSDVGAPEREQCYKPIIDEILLQYPAETCEPSSIKILVPGAGLGRMAWEIATHGFTCQGNEFSLFMLFASHFILNTCTKVNQYTVHPWLHQFVNNMSSEHQLLAARFPDVVPAAGKRKNFSMAAGDFLSVYTVPNEWNCVASCFFIDCAPNVIQFVEIIYNILKPGGLWINLGPLLYHYSDLTTEDSIEPPYDILLDIIKDIGFVILKEKTGLKTRYTQNPNSMLQNEYNSVFFVCQKPLH